MAVAKVTFPDPKMKALHLTWLSEDGKPRTVKIPLWAVFAPVGLLLAVAVLLGVLWSGPWSPPRLRDRLDRLERGNQRLDRELLTARKGLEEVSTAVRMSDKEKERVRELAGMPKDTGTTPSLDEGEGLPDVGKMLQEARRIREGYDAMEDWFQRHPSETGRLPTIRPVRADEPLVEQFGPVLDPFTGQHIEFPGLSWSTPLGTPVWATGAGTVVSVGFQARWGKYVEIRHDERCVTFYGHLSRVDVEEGATVVRGQVLGLSGESGKVTGPQVTYAVFMDGEPTDPRSFLLPEQPKM
jgi:murein DD-endopeptidase MepM/ murein hydrolase activator NlpD